MIGDLIGEWIKGILIDGIMGNLSGLFNTVNTKVGEIASDVGSTPQDWNGGIFSMLQNLSETVIVPIAAAILALVMCYELIDMIVEKNNMHDFDSSMFFRWIFKSAFAILIVTNTWNIVMGVFDARLPGQPCAARCCLPGWFLWLFPPASVPFGYVGILVWLWSVRQLCGRSA